MGIEMDSSQSLKNFFYSTWIIWVVVILLLVIILVSVLRRRLRYRKLTVAATVKEIKEEMATNPTTVYSRNVPLSYAQSMYYVIFTFDDGSELELKASEKHVEALVPGMRGNLTYQGDTMANFIAEK